MRQISLTRGQFALVDDEDFDWLNQWKWRARWAPEARNFYAARNGRRVGKKREYICMHRAILGLQYGDGKIVDHINHNGIDNRRANLRIATHAENMRNRRLQANNKSGYRGVYWSSHYSTWYAAIKVDGKRIRLGSFRTAEAASEAYCAAAKKYHGEFSGISIAA